MNDRPNPIVDIVKFLSSSGWPTPVFWVLLLASCAIAALVWSRDPAQRSARSVSLWLLRLFTGCMWWQQSLWKIPPNYGGLIYWMKQQVAHAAIVLQGELVDTIILPHIGLFGPLVYVIEVAIGISLMVGLLSRWGALLGLLMAINLWLGLYSAPGEWPWTYFFLIIIQALFVIEPPGQTLGADSLISRARPARLTG